MAFLPPFLSKYAKKWAKNGYFYSKIIKNRQNLGLFQKESFENWCPFSVIPKRIIRKLVYFFCKLKDSCCKFGCFFLKSA